MTPYRRPKLTPQRGSFWGDGQGTEGALPGGEETSLWARGGGDQTGGWGRRVDEPLACYVGDLALVRHNLADAMEIVSATEHHPVGTGEARANLEKVTK